MRVGLLGAWSIDNTGDNILGCAVRQALGARLPEAELVLLAPEFPGRWWGHDFGGRGLGAIQAIRPDGSTRWTRRLDAVVIGGGGLAHFHPWFRCFRPGPRWPDRVPAAWNAVGSQSTSWAAATGAERKRLVRSCERLAYLSVRSRATAALLERCGYRGHVPVVPDAVLGASLLGEDRTDTILRRAGAEAGEPLIGVSVGNAIRQSRTARFYDRLAAGIRALGMRALIFPFGRVYGDAASQAAMAARLPRSLLVRGRIGPLDCWRLAGRMRLSIGCRFHAMLAAYSQNVPFLAVDEYLSAETATSEIREFCVERGLELHWTSPYLPGDPAAKLDRVAARPPDFTLLLTADRRRLDRHYRDLVAALRAAA